jgi:hypothetical protein
MKVEDIKPKILKVDETEGTFGTTATTWSDSEVTWSDADAIWGGADTLADPAPQMLSSRILKSANQVVQDIKSGFLGVATVRPTMIGVSDIGAVTPTEVVLVAGQPMGLLLSLTYPTTGTVTQ